MNRTLIVQLVSLVVACMVAGNAFAATQIDRTKTIYQVNVYRTYALLRFTPPEANAEGCTHNDSDSIVAIPYDQSEGGKQILATALAAFTAAKRVGFGLDGCYGTNSHPEVYRIDVRDD